ncbi:maintenance of telomere capping protein 1 [Chaetomidium leptoderma]|uniref:Maintenance of telomere capping protein 1 n=1 Tax=Chaetomidium leptoderma TaxID=669021 RepID=A0AAN6ZUR7_9PEZI|nr:maintenance of telomere capping protein 1 [Chaetomidium leptoderma]
MASKRTKAAPTDDELGELFEGLGDDTNVKKATKTKPTSAKAKGDAAEQDILAELENQLGEKAPERPHTPRVRDVVPKPSPAKRTSTNTPPLGVDNARKSAESAASHRASFTPSATSSEPQESEKRASVQPPQAASAGGGGGWWGGILSTATAAMKQAEAAVKEIQQNEEAKKWADQVRGNVGALRGFGDDLRHRALPTFTDILHTLAPPISSHERLLIHISHDLVGYPSLDPLIYGVFNRVMAQVEGGDLMVIQRGQEFTLRSPSSAEKTGAASLFGGQQSAAGWRDGPWWRQTDAARDLGVVQGLVEGTKLCRANAEGYAADYFAAHGGIEEAKQRAVEVMSESNPVRRSDIFLSVQALNVPADQTLFAGSTAVEKEKETSVVAEEDDDAEGEVCFAVFILDPVHEIQFAAVSQRVPARWIRWLDAPATPLTPASGDEDFQAEFGRVPDEIREIIESGGVDPREWVAEWVEEALGLSVGVVAQKYVARRMGVGEGGIGKGKQKVESVLEAGGNEIARAGLI